MYRTEEFRFSYEVIEEKVRAEGHKEGRVEGREEGLKEGMNIASAATLIEMLEALMQNTNLDLARACYALNKTEAEYYAAKELLSNLGDQE